MLHGTGIIVRHGGQRILDEVAVSIIGGEVVGLMGPSGSGKSTLLGVLAGDIIPSAGEVWLAGKPVQNWSLQERAVRRAVLSQNASLDFPLRVFDVVRMGRAPHISLTESRHDREISEAALRWVQAEHLRDRLYTTLSGGERQQVQLARILAQVWGRPAQGDCYVFFDEPTTGLDVVQQHRTLSVAKQLAADGAAVVMVLHDLNLAAQYCDRLLLLRAGALQAEGAPATVLTRHTIQNVYNIDVTLAQHPTLSCPLIVPKLPAA